MNTGRLCIEQIMSSRRTFLIGGTTAFASSIAGCGAGTRDALPTDSASTTSPSAAPPPPASSPPAPSAPAPPPAAPSPPPASATADWLARSAAAGVVVACDFSSSPANGGTYKWGSLKASPHVTCYQQNDASYGQYVVVDSTICPPGSTASLRWDVPDCPTSGTAERGDLWWVSIDDYADQFGSGAEFWVQWRTRMNSTYATFPFADRSGGFTAYKQLMCGEGMQPGNIGTQPQWPYGFRGPGTSIAQNQISGVRVDFEGETNFIGTIGVDATTGTVSPTAVFKYPSAYHGKPTYVSLITTDGAYFTHHNSGNEGSISACKYQLNGQGVVDRSSCFTYPTDEWFTLMAHVQLGTLGHGFSSIPANAAAVPANWLSATRVVLPDQSYPGHFNPAAAGGMYIRIRGNLTGSVDAKVTAKATIGPTMTFTGVVAGLSSGTLTAPVGNGTYDVIFSNTAQRALTVTGGTAASWSPALPADAPITSGYTGGGTTKTFIAGVDGATSGTFTSPVPNGTYDFTFSNGETRVISVSGGVNASWTGPLRSYAPTTTCVPQQATLTFTGATGIVRNEPLFVDEYENGYVNSTIEYYGAYSGGPMQLVHRRTGVVMRVGNYVNDSTGYTGTAKYGTFAWTTFMTGKSLTQTHPVAKVWVSQIIIKSGPGAPATPAF